MEIFLSLYLTHRYEKFIFIELLTPLEHFLTASLTWKENRDRVVNVRAEIRFVDVIFSDFSYEIPFHHRPGQIERINF